MQNVHAEGAAGDYGGWSPCSSGSKAVEHGGTLKRMSLARANKIRATPFLSAIFAVLCMRRTEQWQAIDHL